MKTIPLPLRKTTGLPSDKDADMELALLGLLTSDLGGKMVEIRLPILTSVERETLVRHVLKALPHDEKRSRVIE